MSEQHNITGDRNAIHDDEFIQLVYEMREHQKAYFETRSQVELNIARSLERRVDAALRIL